MIALKYHPLEISKAIPYKSVSPLIAFLSKYDNVPADIISAIQFNTDIIHIKKNKFITSPLDRNENYYLVVKGVARCFVKDGKSEITTWLIQENSIMGRVHQNDYDYKNEEYIQALEDSELVVIPKIFLEFLYANYPASNILCRKILEDYAADAVERWRLCTKVSAEDRYKYFLKRYPGLEDRISNKYIASYLSIRPETISRIKKTIFSN